MPGLGITYGTCSLRREPYTDPHIPLKMRTPILSWKTPILSLRVLCVFCHENSKKKLYFNEKKKKSNKISSILIRNKESPGPSMCRSLKEH